MTKVVVTLFVDTGPGGPWIETHEIEGDYLKVAFVDKAGGYLQVSTEDATHYFAREYVVKVVPADE